MSENVAKVKSKKFAIAIVETYKKLCREKKEYTLSNQLLRAGTSIGANLVESENAISKKDFLAKVYIALKECSETLYWLELLFETNYLSQKDFETLYRDGEEIKRILMAATKTLKNSLD